MEKFVNFSQLLNYWKLSKNTALLYDDEGTKRAITYEELADRIYDKIPEYQDRRNTCILAICDKTPDTIVRIFAPVIAGLDVIMTPETLHPSEIVKVRDTCYDVPEQPCRDGIRPEGRLLFYTSGTTSYSRPVILTPQSLLTSAWCGQNMLPCSDEDIILSMLPFSHIFGFVCTFLWGACYGATIALGRGFRGLKEDCQYFKPTILPIIPPMIDAFVKQDILNRELRKVLIGAALVKEATVNALQEKGIHVYLGYGLTETSSGIAITKDQKTPYAMAPCPGVDIRIEEDGEISVETPAMMHGYLGETGPCIGARLYTGDLGRLDDRGYLVVTGRKSDILTLSDGSTINCPEFEADFACVTGHEELCLILKEDKLVLIIGPKVTGRTPLNENERELIFQNIREYNETQSPEGQISEVIYVTEVLPRTFTGKLKRWKITEFAETYREQ